MMKYHSQIVIWLMAAMIGFSGQVKAPKMLRVGTYPPLANLAGIQGEVRIGLDISRSGFLNRIAIMHGHPLLGDAVKEWTSAWRFEPNDVDYRLEFVVNFHLRNEMCDGKECHQEVEFLPSQREIVVRSDRRPPGII